MSDYESYDDENDDYGILKKALDVELPDDFDPDKIPQTGEEYLQHVIYERAKCKTWLTASIDRSQFEHKQTFKIEVDQSCGTPTSLLPTPAWQTAKLEEFTNFRKFINFQKTKEATITAFDEDRFAERTMAETPKFSEIIQLAQAANIRMLQIIVKSLDPNEPIGNNLGSWIYAILTLLEKPLSPNSCHSLREFAKKCRTIRAALDETTCKSTVAPLNLFICIVARFYSQLDLADPQ